MKKLIYVFVCLTVISVICNSAGTTAVESLKLGAGARAAGMGGAFAGIASDTSALYWNPAGLNRIGSMCGSFMHGMLPAGISYEWLSFVYPVKNTGNFGGSLAMVNYGSIEGMDEYGFETGEKFSPSDMILTAGYGMIIKSYDMPVGATLKIISSKITKSGTGFAIDLGGMYRLKKYNVTLGFALQNIGSGIKYIGETDSLPMNIKIGGAYPVKKNWTIAGDINLPSGSDMNIAVGTEYNYKLENNMAIAGRAGFNTGTSVLSLGAGLTYDKYNFDISFSLEGELGTPIRLSLGKKF